jgi:hypothetical protein
MDLSNIPIAARFNVSINTFQLPSFSTAVEVRVHVLNTFKISGPGGPISETRGEPFLIFF